MLINHIYQADCLEIFKNHIPAGSIDLIVADPPYNLSGKSLEWEEKGYKKVNEAWDTIDQEDYKKFTKEWIEASYNSLKANGSIYVCCSKHNLSTALSTVETSGFRVNNVITWVKTNPAPLITCRTFTYASEFLIYAVKGPGYVFNYEALKEINPDRQKNGNVKAMRDVWLMPFCAGHERIKEKDGKAAHPTQKPEALIRRCIIASSNPNDIVLDPFVGVGTTAAVCKKENRRWIGIDLEEKYVNLSNERLNGIVIKQESSELQPPT